MSNSISLVVLLRRKTLIKSIPSNAFIDEFINCYWIFCYVWKSLVSWLCIVDLLFILNRSIQIIYSGLCYCWWFAIASCIQIIVFIFIVVYGININWEISSILHCVWYNVQFEILIKHVKFTYIPLFQWRRLLYQLYKTVFLFNALFISIKKNISNLFIGKHFD